MSNKNNDEMSIEAELFEEDFTSNDVEEQEDEVSNELSDDSEDEEDSNELSDDTDKETDKEDDGTQRELEQLRAENAKLLAKNKKLYKDDKKKLERIKELEKGNKDEVKIELTDEEKELAYSDPIEFAELYAKKKMEALDKRNVEKTQKQKDEEFQEALADAQDELRAELKDYDSVMLNEAGFLKVDHIPPKQLREWQEKGLTIKQQLQELYKILGGAKISNPKTQKQPSIGDMGGSAKLKQTNKNITSNYDKLK